MRKAGKLAVIPPQANRKEQRPYDKELYKARHLIENFFAKLKLSCAITAGKVSGMIGGMRGWLPIVYKRLDRSRQMLQKTVQ